MINMVDVIADTIIAGCALFLLYITQQEKISLWRGLKNFSGGLRYTTQNVEGLYTEEGFDIFVRNGGLVSQSVNYIADKKGGLPLCFFKSLDQRNLEVKPGDVLSVFLSATDDNVRDLKNAKGLFLVNRFGKRKKIASKKDIQEALKTYRKYSKR